MIAFINSPFQAYVLRCYLSSLKIAEPITVIIREYNNNKELSDNNAIKQCLIGKNIDYIIIRNGISKFKIFLIFYKVFFAKLIIIGDLLNKFNTFFLMFKFKKIDTLLLEDGTSFHVDNAEIYAEIIKHSIDNGFCISGIPDNKYGEFKIKLGQNYPLPLSDKNKLLYKSTDKFIILGSPLIEHNVSSENDYDNDLEQLISYVEGSNVLGDIVYFRHRREKEERLRTVLSRITNTKCDIRRSTIGFDIDLLSSQMNHYLNDKVLISFPSTAILVLAQNNLLYGCKKLCLKKSSIISNAAFQERSDRIFDLCLELLIKKGINHVVL